MTARQFLIAVCVVLLIALLAVFAWAAGREPISAGFAAVTASPWGWATLADLYVGFLLFATWVISTERNTAVALLWCVALLLLGNPVALVFLIRRAWRSRGPAELLLGSRAGR